MAAKKDHTYEKRVRDPVEEMKVFKECVNKQKLSEKIYENFQINTPQHRTTSGYAVSVYSEKPNTNKMLLMKMKDQRRTINGVDYEEVLHSESDGVQLPDHVTNRLSTMEQVPKGKWSMPQTSNQEIGWHVANSANGSKFTYPRKGCNETGYADNYYTMKHYSPFSNKNEKK